MSPIPRNPDIEQLLAEANRLFEAGALEEAAGIYRTVAATQPVSSVIVKRLAKAASARGDHAGAVELLGKLLDATPRDADAWIDHALELRDLGRHLPALASMQRATELQPDSEIAWRYIGVIQMECGRTAEAIAAWERGLRANPRSTRIHTYLGLLHSDLGQLRDAISNFDAALAIDPHEPLARSLKGECLLLAGEYAQGWKLYESRFGTGFRRNHWRGQIEQRPRWTGSEPLADRTIVVHPEVGFGDFLMFARYIPLLEKLGAHVVAYCHASLASLVRTSFTRVTVVPVGARLPEFDFQCPIMSLPLAFGTVAESIPTTMPYLAAGEAKLHEWGQRLGPRRAMRVGLAWSSQLRPIDQSPLRRRSMALEDVRSLFASPIEFHVVQKDIDPRDRDALAGEPRVHAHDSFLADFSDTAALIEHMDAVVTIDTSVAHVAGALGKPTFVMLPPACDYRWTRSADRSPWYPSSSLHRRPAAGSWREPVETIRNLLLSVAQP